MEPACHSLGNWLLRSFIIQAKCHMRTAEVAGICLFWEVGWTPARELSRPPR